MGNLFAGREIVEFGVEIEKNGASFYKALAERSKDAKARGLFLFLEGEEVRHIAIFQKILESVKRYEPQQAYSSDYFAYIRALAADYVFTQKDKGGEIARQTRNDREAIDLGIGFEKESILFYEGMKKVVPERDHPILDGLIKQEHGHLLQLTGLRTSAR